MDRKIVKEVVNFVSIIIFTLAYISYIMPLINQVTKERLISIGLWGVVVGVWGNIVGMRLVKPLIISKNYKNENYFFIALGTIMAIIGLFYMLVF